MQPVTTRQAWGRTWARLVDDLLRMIPNSGFLAKDPLQMATSMDSKTVNNLAFINPESCPMSEDVDEMTTRYWFIMTNTRYHVELTVKSSLPTADHDLHLQSFHHDESKEFYQFESASTDTSVGLVIYPPEFSESDWRMFDQMAIDRRWKEYKTTRTEEMKEAPPQPPTAAMCLNTLFKLIENVFSNPRPIAANNSTLNLRVKPELLVSELYFTHDVEGKRYIPPDLSAGNEEEECQTRRHVLRRILSETAATLFKRSTSTNNNAPEAKLEQAAAKLKRVLPHPDDSANTIGQQVPQVSSQVYASLVILGCCEYFSRALVLSRFQRQWDNDPKTRPVYLEALYTLASWYSDPDMEVKAGELVSLGYPMYSALQAAYNQLGLNIANDNEEELIVEKYKEVGKKEPGRRQELKTALETISQTVQPGLKIREVLSMENMTADNALAFLGAIEESDDDAVKTLFEFKMNQNLTDQREILLHALLVIAKDRKSNVLLRLYEEQTFGEESTTTEELTVQQASDLLQVSKDMDANTILTLYDIRVQDDPNRILEYRQSLRAIANSTDNATIREFLGDKVEPQQRERKPVGLGNIGNTCYLNSLLQCYFTIRPLRDAVLNYSTKMEDLEKFEGKKVGGRQVQPFEVKRAQMFIELLSGLFTEMETSQQSHVLPKKSLAYMALVPAAADEQEIKELEENQKRLAEQAAAALVESENKMQVDEPVGEFVEDEDTLIDLGEEEEGGVKPSPQANPPVEEKEKEGKEDKENEEPEAPPPLPTRPEPKSEQEQRVEYPKQDQVENALAMGGQQDVTECIDNVLFQIEAGLKGQGDDSDGEQLDVIKQLFYGKSKQVLENAKTGENRREQVNRFNCFLIHVGEGIRDVYDALDSQHGENIIELGSGDTAVPTRRIETLTQLPEIIQIQIQRVQYNREIQAPFKNTGLVRFDEVIYLDRYLDTDDQEVIRKRHQVAEWKVELKQAKTELNELVKPGDNGQTIEQSLKLTIEWLQVQQEQVGDGDSEKPFVSEATLEALKQEHSKLVETVQRHSTTIQELESKIQNQFSDMKNVPYRVHAVFIHRGSATQGHYWIYINDIENGCFRKYNDEYVTTVPYSEVFSEDESPTAATPYYVTYVRDDLDYIEALPVTDEDMQDSSLSSTDDTPGPPPLPSTAPPPEPEHMSID